MSDSEPDNDNWDVEKYRVDYESEEHWELRKAFMETHRENFGEDEIVCLARVFTNVEFLGCRYSNEVMKQIAELSKGIIEKYRRSRQGRLKRTFVGAAEAAQNKVQRK
ncbi:CLUMA_CG008439, isoform A [Clunio marinus]|uniref:CLUMA_CG008439, isoform A n=1 Tax=Clunio marinus TaxID=568069 RepID=A0A1J1I3N5_9DIPT|nr:CLUMA_CG008439, isoform A [Clunio marinus]